jgi:hypothetical protein
MAAQRRRAAEEEVCIFGAFEPSRTRQPTHICLAKKMRILSWVVKNMARFYLDYLYWNVCDRSLDQKNAENA